MRAGKTSTAEKIIGSLKGLQAHLQPGEQPLFTMPAIWDNGRTQRGTACDIVVSNQRVFGYYFVSFPRERLFLDAFSLDTITNIALRQKSFEPLFRELLISDGRRKVYVRAPRQKIEALYATLRATIEEHAASAPAAELLSQQSASDSSATSAPPPRQSPIYGRQEIHRPFERSPLAMTLLFVGGLLLEILGVALWTLTQDAPAGVPLCVAGFLAVFMALVMGKQKR